MRKTKLLIVDDEEAFVSTLAKRLAYRDIEVVVAHSGEAGLRTLDQQPSIDVVLLDAIMPGLAGIDALELLKRNHPLVEIIMLTEQEQIETAIHGMKLGAFDYLAKPFDIEELVARVKEAADKRRLHMEKMGAAIFCRNNT